MAYYVAEGAVIKGNITIGEDSGIWYNATIRGDSNQIAIGSRTNVQDNAVVHVSSGYPVSIGNDVTIIILSAYDYSEIKAEAREAGVDEFIAKSLFRSRLTATLKNIIEGKSNKEANIETAENGKEAVEKFANAPSGFYDLIFMDIHMPVMNGYEATAAIRSHRKYREKQIPIIAMTANAFAEDVVMAKNAGMKEHIAKPWEMNRLCEIMQRYL